MNHFRTSTLLLGLFGPLALSQPTWAQDAEAEENPTQESDALSFHYANDLVGKDLLTRAGEDEGETEDLGDISNLLFDTATGKITGVVISSGGVAGVGEALRVIQWSDISWGQDDDGASITLVQWTEDEFDALPEARTNDARTRLRGANAARQDDTNPDGSESPRRPIEAGARPGRAAYITGTRATAGLEVYGRGALKPYGTIGQAVIDAKDGSIAYFTVEAMGEYYLLPHRAVELRSVYAEPSIEENGEVELAAVTELGRGNIRRAPRIAEDEGHTIQNALFMRSVENTFPAERRARRGEAAEGRPAERRVLRDGERRRRGGDEG